MIIQFNKPDTIDLNKIKQNNMQIRTGLILPASETVQSVIAADHTSEPIKNMDDIISISEYFINSKRYRDNMLFIVGINFGLRVSDLIQLRFSNLINDNLTFKDTFPVFEQKTRNTRKRKKNRYITINQAVRDAVILFLENTENVSLSDYMFKSESNNAKSTQEHIHRCSVDRVLKGAARDLGLNVKMSTHTLRKTFAYHQMLMSNNDPRKLMLLQKMMGHSSPAQTLDYIGITNEEIQEAYRNFNLGSTTHNYLIDGQMLEQSEEIKIV